MAYQVKLDDARARLRDLVEAALQGEEVFIQVPIVSGDPAFDLYAVKRLW